MLKQVCFQLISKLGLPFLGQFPAGTGLFYASVGKVMVFLHGL